jgi:hypothetical protein
MELLGSMNKWALLSLIQILAVSGCMSLAENAGRIADGSKFAEKILETHRGENGITLSTIRFRDKRTALKLTFDSKPNFAFYLSPAGETGRYILSSYTFLASTLKGWNEFTVDLSGTGSLEVLAAEGKERLRLTIGNIEEIGISSGRIRAGENRVGGGEALRILRNRKDRIDALTGWMKEYAAGSPATGAASTATGNGSTTTGNGSTATGNGSTATGGSSTAGGSAGALSFQNEKEFDAYWKPILLPEMVPKRKRPAAYKGRRLAGRDKAEWVRAEDVTWNAAYSAGHFPEDIAMLRNSGALLRDWEEALPWIYLSFQWGDIINSITGELYFEALSK